MPHRNNKLKQWAIDLAVFFALLLMCVGLGLAVTTPSMATPTQHQYATELWNAQQYATCLELAELSDDRNLLATEAKRLEAYVDDYSLEIAYTSGFVRGVLLTEASYDSKSVEQLALEAYHEVCNLQEF